jgi:vanillate O-demethylase ferredoxin subunit
MDRADRRMTEIKVRVKSVAALTPDIRKFELVAETDGAELPLFEAGAHIDVQTGAGVRRSYSLANDPDDTRCYVTAVLREPNGSGGSKWMHDAVKEDDVLTVTEPANQFPLEDEADFHLMIAGGIGITPLLAMGYALRRRDEDYHLYYCTKSAKATAFLDEVKAVFDDHVTFIHDGGDIAKGIKLDEVLADAAEGRHLYVCGPAGLINATRETAAKLGWADDAVHFELFSSAKTNEQRAEDAAARADDGSFEVELAQSGMTLTIPADKSILEVLNENGIPVMFTCEDGWCGNCQVPMLGGEADHRDEVLTEAEKAENSKIQVCISRAKPGQKLILDI